jgi:hypothetical protein
MDSTVRLDVRVQNRGILWMRSHRKDEQINSIFPLSIATDLVVTVSSNSLAFSVVTTMTEEEEEKAREEAEARRQKILQSSTDRLGVVTGAPGGEPEDEDAEEAKKAKTLSKMAQARRRRFKKKGDDEAAPAATSSTADAAGTTATSDPSPESKQDDAKPNAPSEEGKEKETPDRGEAEKEGDTPVAAPFATETAISEAAATASDDAADGASKKKYQGVARVRRQMLKERQQKRQGEGDSGKAGSLTQQDGSEHIDGTSASASFSSSRKTHSRSQHQHHPTRSWLSSLPVLMHLVTTLLLFGAGFDVGMQQRPAPTAEVHVAYAPRQELYVLRMLPARFKSSKNATDSSGVLPSAEELMKQAEEARDLVVDDAAAAVDEFAVGLDDDGGAEQPVIDPLFGVDLDLYTRGDNLYMVAARGAVRLHRINLSIFYYLPRRFAYYVIGTLHQLAKSPPLLCLIAIAVRQVVGKLVLGAKLPPPKALVEDEAHKEVTGMIVQAIKGFFLRSFPTVFTLYDIFSHLKNDMYVVLCGLLVGLAHRHSVLAPAPNDVGAAMEDEAPVGTDEL